MKGWLDYLGRLVLVVAFLFTNVLPLGAVTTTGVDRRDLLLSGLKLDGDKLVFYWRGEDGRIEEIPSDKAKEVLSYFYSALAIPEENWWVDLFLLNTDEDVMGPGLEWTKLGYTMVDADLRMKVRINELMNPDSEVGAELWERLAEIGVDSFMPRFWMVPGEVKFYSDEDATYIKSARIDVKVEIEDKGLDEGLKEEIKRIVEETIVPALEEEINEGKEFAELRKAYYSMLLASWVKNRAKEGMVSGKLASIVDSYVLPDVGMVRVDRWAFLREFDRHYLFGEVEGAFLSVRGGGEDFEETGEKISDEKATPGNPEEKAKEDGSKDTKTDTPDMRPDGGYKFLENKAREFGIEPRRNVVGIFGNVEFKGVEPKDVVGLNVVIINLSDEVLEINKEFVEKYGGQNQFYDSSLSGLSNMVVVKWKTGEVTTMSIPPGELQIQNEQDAVKFLDTVAKVLFQKKKLLKEFPSIEQVGLFFSQRPGEEVPVEEQITIKVLVGEDNVIFPTQYIPSSSTRVRNGGANHLVTDGVRKMLEDVYFPRWSSYEVLKKKESEGQLTEEERSRLEQIEKKIKEQERISEVLLGAINKGVEALRRGDEKAFEEANRQIDMILDAGIRVGNKQVFLDGYGVHLAGSRLVGMIEDAVKNNEQSVRDYLMQVRRGKLYEYNMRLVEERYLGQYSEIVEYAEDGKKKSPSEQIESGKLNLRRMIGNNAKELFGVEIDPITFEPDFASEIEKAFEELKSLEKRGVLSSEEIKKLEEIKIFTYPKGLYILSKVRKELEKAYEGKVGTAYESIKRFLDLKEMHLAYIDVMKTYEEIERNLRDGEIDPNKKALRIAYLPMKGDPWQVGHIWVIAKLLASGKVDKVIVTVDNGDPRKPKLSDGMVRGPISELLMKRLFGPFVEFSTLPFDRPELFKKTGEEMIVDLVEHLSERYGREGKEIKAFFYVAGSDHAKFLNIKNIRKEQEKINQERVAENERLAKENKPLLPLLDFEKAISDFLNLVSKESGLSLWFDTKQGILRFTESNLTPAGPTDDLRVRIIERENGEFLLMDDGMILLPDIKPLPPEAIETARKFVEKLPSNEASSEEMREIIRDLRQAVGYGRPERKAGQAPARPGGLLLSEIGLR